MTPNCRQGAIEAPAQQTRAGVQQALAERLGSAIEARWMVEEVLGRQLPRRAPVGEGDREVLHSLADRRLSGEPLQYVLGSWAFRRLELAVDQRALIPRPETEQVVDVALAEVGRIEAASSAAPARVVVDLGTGTGAIALSLAVELGEGRCRSQPGGGRLEVWATDVDHRALALAEANRDRVTRAWPGLLAGERIELRQGSWFEALPPWLRGRVDLLVSNPPYVAASEWPLLDREVRREPRGALVAADGSDGTPGFAGVEAVVAGARTWLAPGGAVVVELAPSQAAPARRLACRLGLRDVRVAPDLAGRDRVLVGVV